MMMKNKQKPAREELERLIQKIDGMMQEQGMSDEAIMRWLQVAEDDQVPIETAEWLGQAISEHEYGIANILIVHHKVEVHGMAATTKPRFEKGNRTVQLPKRPRRKHDGA